MWNKVSKSEEKMLLDLAVKLMSDHKEFGIAMHNVSLAWVNTFTNHLTNKSINHKAFIGQCAAFYKKQIPEYIVRNAWKLLNDEQRIMANIEAGKVLKKWQNQYIQKLNNTLKHGKKDAIKQGFQMKFQFN